MLRSWYFWLSLFLVALSLGWFWVLTHDLTFTRLEADAPPAASDKGG